MNTQIDWRSELDSSFGNGADRPPADFLGPAHAALRRRRTAMGAAVLAGVIVVGGIGWAFAPDDGGPRSSDVATDPSASTSPSPTETVATLAPIADEPDDVRAALPGEVEDFASDQMPPVTPMGSGELVRRANWEIEAIYVLVDKPRERVWGISAVPAAGGEAVWMLVNWRPRSSGILSDPEGKRFAVFEDWLDVTWTEQQGIEVPTDARAVDGQLELAPGVEALETVNHPAEAAAYGPVGEFVAAKLRLVDGSIVFSLVGPEGGTTVDPAVLDAPTMDAFLRHLQGQGDSGEGLR